MVFSLHRFRLEGGLFLASVISLLCSAPTACTHPSHVFVCVLRNVAVMIVS